MMRVTLALLAGLLCGIAGVRQASHIRDDSARLLRWQTLLEHLALLLYEGALPLPEVFQQAATEPSAPDKLLRTLARAMQEKPLASLPELYAAMQQDGPEAPILTRMMSGLCRGSLESRRLAVTQAAQEIALLASSTQDKAYKDARMWSTLGWTGGACLALLLI